jgi:hypothetical protein
MIHSSLPPQFGLSCMLMSQGSNGTITSQCDAVDELIRYAEGSRGKKLPPHPAYLEARRVLQKHAQELAGQPMLARADTPPTASAAAVSESPEQSVETDKPRRPLPPMEMAKTW